MLTVERLRELLHYDPETGVFTWLAGTRVGIIAGCHHVGGYIRIRTGGKGYLAHRLAWLYTTGAWPPAEIDHVNGVTNDNRMCNLRAADHGENLQNQRRARSDSASQFLGVDQRRGKWRTQIVVNGRKKHLGYFPSAELAHEFYLLAKEMVHPFSSIGG